MADEIKKYENNIDGIFFVDKTCIDCELCQSTAPRNFKRNEKETHSFVFKQPENQQELTLCIKARKECPVSAIGPEKEDDIR